MLFHIGYLFLVMALVFSLFGLVAGFWGGSRRNAGLVQSSFRAVYEVAILVCGAAVILWYGILNDHFEVAYVWNHSERALSTFYKFAALWGGQAGSLLFWGLILSIYSVATAYAFRNSQRLLMPFVNAVMLGTSAFFLILLVFAVNPFELYEVVPADGRGLNPLLQNYWMVIHPVMLYLGFVGLTVPFAFAVAVLLSKKTDNQWVRIVRRWTLFAWMFLGAGILMGSQWAYMELGWGGYWAWDPVENASFLPWLTATAFLHSILIQERRGILKYWNLVLIGATYFLVILGTFTTRSGLISSVHSFAQSPVGWYFLVFLTITLLGYVTLLFMREKLLRADHTIESMVSREAAFLANNWLLSGITFATLFGTYYATFSELLTGSKISLSAPYFNKVVSPLFLLLLLLMAIGPLLGWRKTSGVALRRQLRYPVTITLVFAAVYSFVSPRFFPILGLSVCVFVTATIVQEYVRGVTAWQLTHPQQNVVVALLNLVRRNAGRYGGYIVHLGIVLICIAVIGNEFYQSTTQATLARGDGVDLAGYRFTFTGLTQERAANRDEFTAALTVIDLQNDNRLVGITSPKRNLYDKRPDQPTSEVGLIMRPSVDLYVVLNGWENGGALATFTIFVNPLTMWMWVGGIVLILGTLICAWPDPVRNENATVIVGQPVAA